MNSTDSEQHIGLSTVNLMPSGKQIVQAGNKIRTHTAHTVTLTFFLLFFSLSFTTSFCCEYSLAKSEEQDKDVSFTIGQQSDRQFSIQ
jgi:hypothetical protein